MFEARSILSPETAIGGLVGYALGGRRYGAFGALVGAGVGVAIKSTVDPSGRIMDAYRAAAATAEASATTTATATTETPATTSSASSSSGVLRRGSSGAAVRALQTQLVRLGYKITIDGNYGTGTESAVRSFQTAHKLTGTGIADGPTLALVAALAAVPVTR